MWRLTGFARSLVLAGIVFIAGTAMLAAGYWLSDRVYDAGLWPVGAFMRVVLLLSLLGWAFSLFGILAGAVGSLLAHE
jgi:hypothetical protein